MTKPTKPISLSDIHSVYCGSTAKKQGEALATHSYKKTDRFAREAGHNGASPQRTLTPSGRKIR